MKTVIATALLALSLQVSAHDTDGSLSSKVEFAKHSEMVSEAGEGQEQFLIRVARAMQSVTAETGYEYCARLGMNENGFAVVITTNKSQIGCLVTAETVPGYAPSALHIHSHPHARFVRAIEADLAFVKDAKVGDRIKVQTFTFSNTDYNGSAGYLVTVSSLMYQWGRGNVTTVAEL